MGLIDIIILVLPVPLLALCIVMGHIRNKYKEEDRPFDECLAQSLKAFACCVAFFLSIVMIFVKILVIYTLAEENYFTNTTPKVVEQKEILPIQGDKIYVMKMDNIRLGYYKPNYSGQISYAYPEERIEIVYDAGGKPYFERKQHRGILYAGKVALFKSWPINEYVFHLNDESEYSELQHPIQ